MSSLARVVRVCPSTLSDQPPACPDLKPRACHAFFRGVSIISGPELISFYPLPLRFPLTHFCRLLLRDCARRVQQASHLKGIKSPCPPRLPTGPLCGVSLPDGNVSYPAERAASRYRPEVLAPCVRHSCVIRSFCNRQLRGVEID